MDINALTAIATGVVAATYGFLEWRKKDDERVQRKLDKYRNQALANDPMASLASIPFGQVFEAQVFATRTLNLVYEKSLVMEKRQNDMEKQMQEMKSDSELKDRTIARHEKRIKKLESLLEEKGIPIPPDTDEVATIQVKRDE